MTNSNDICPDCLTASGRLCVKCSTSVLPQLAVNIGWLKLMGESRTEQVSRQRKITKSPTISDAQAAHLVRKRLARRSARGYRGLAAAILAA